MMTKTVWLAGTNHADLPKLIALAELPNGLPVKLKREPENEFDENAISAWVEAGELQGAGFILAQLPNKPEFKLGMIPARDGTTSWLAPKMDAGTFVVAVFAKHGRNLIHAQIEMEIDEDRIA